MAQLPVKVVGSDLLRGLMPATVYAELQRTSQLCYSRGLFHSSRWAAEMACAMDASAKAQAKIAAPSSDPAVTLPLLHLAARDLPQALSSSEKLTSTQGKFLHLYCRYMEGEQQRNTSVSIEEMIAGKSDQGNPHLLSIRRDLEALHQSDRDGFTLFLYGAVLAQLQQKEKAIEALIESVRLLPGNYAAWQELVSLYRPKQNTVLQLPVHWATSLFEALLFLEMRDGERALAPLAELRKLFPGSAFLISNHALAYYMSRNFRECEAIFESQIAQHPKRTDHLDTFSNQLHVEQKLPRLATLAQQVQEVAPYRPETACIIGNFYSLRGDHAKALASFMQALKFNRRYLNAWILLGHEFCEVDNPHAAAQAYHRALAINSSEYRAWFGLGQIFDRVLKTPRLSLFYYLRSVRLKPADQRLWCTLGFAFANANVDIGMAIRALERAKDTLPAVDKLIEIYTELKDLAKVQHWQQVRNTLAGDEEEEEVEDEDEKKEDE